MIPLFYPTNTGGRMAQVASTGHKCEEGEFAHEECDDTPLPIVATVYGDFFDTVEIKGVTAALYWLANVFNINLPSGVGWRTATSTGLKDNGYNPLETEKVDGLNGIVALDDVVYITDKIIDRAFQTGDMTLLLGIMLHEGWHAWVEHTIEAKPENKGIDGKGHVPGSSNVALAAIEVSADNAARRASGFGIDLSDLTTDMLDQHTKDQKYPSGTSPNDYINTEYGVVLPLFSVLYGR